MKVFENRKTSILTPIIGIAVQVLSWLVLFPIGVAVHKHPLGSVVFNVFAALWFFIPMAAIFGLYAGIVYIRQKGKDTIVSAGVCLNLLWFTGFLCVCYLVFYLGVTA